MGQTLVSSRLQAVTENEKPAGRGGHGVAFGFCPWMRPSHETARCYAGVQLCEGVMAGLQEEEPTRFAHKQGAHEVLLTHMGSGSWNNSPSGFPRLAK